MLKVSRPLSVSRPIFDGLCLEASGLILGLGLEGCGLVNIPGCQEWRHTGLCTPGLIVLTVLTVVVVLHQCLRDLWPC